MASIVNERDLILQATSPRITPPALPQEVLDTIAAVKGVKITAPSNVFQINTAGTASPASITLLATLTLITGTVTWSVVAGTATLTGSGNTRTLTAANMSTPSVTIRASVTDSGITYTDNWTIAKTADGQVGAAGPIAPEIRLQKTSTVFQADKDNVVTTFNGGENQIRVFQGNAELSYDGVGTSNGTWALSVIGTQVTPGTVTDSGTYASISDPTAIASSLAATYITFTATGRTLQGASFTLQAVHVFGKARAGIPGGKFANVTAYRWSNSGAGSFSASATYNWSTKAPSTYPSGWTATAPASPGSGYTLYQLTVSLQAEGDATSTAFSWSSGAVSTVGYRQDGSIGPQGPGARIAYMVTTSATPPALGATQPVVGDTLPNGSARPGSTALNTWSATPKATLAAGEFMYQSDGAYDPETNRTSWLASYLSNLKVGSLSALSAVLGVVQIASGGSLYSGKPGPASTAAGFWLGYDGTNYQFFIGNSGDTKSLRWNGSDLSVKGGRIIGSEFSTAESGPRIRLFSAGGDAHKLQATGDVAGNIVQIAAPGQGGNVFWSTSANFEVLSVRGNCGPAYNVFQLQNSGVGEAMDLSSEGNGIYAITKGDGIILENRSSNGNEGRGLVLGNATNDNTYIGIDARSGTGRAMVAFNTLTNKERPDVEIGSPSSSIGGVFQLRLRNTFPTPGDGYFCFHVSHGLCYGNGSVWKRVADDSVVG